MTMQTLNNGETLGTIRGKINLNFAELEANKIGSTSVLLKTNTTPFTPSGEYNPATKSYADSLHASIKAVYDPTGKNADAFNRANHYGNIAATSITEDSDNRFITDAERVSWTAKEPAIGTKGTAFNKNFGTTSGTVAAGNHTHTKTDLGLGNVDNTSDVNKPVSTAQQAALDAKAAISTIYTKTQLDAGQIKKLGDVAGGNYFEIASNGQVTLHGNTRAFEDINFDLLAIGKAGTGEPDVVTLGPTTIQAAGFDGSSTLEAISANRELPHDYAEGSDIIPHVHWFASDSGSGNVFWQLEFVVVGQDGTVTGSTTIDVETAADGAWKRVDAYFPALSGTSFKRGDQLFFRFFRDPTDTLDTYANDAVVATVGFHYLRNGFGTLTHDINE